MEMKRLFYLKIIIIIIKINQQKWSGLKVSMIILKIIKESPKVTHHI